MDISSYKKEFVSESNEHINLSNEKILVLEKNPGDVDALNELFRSFHTLKGNSAAMGYAKFSDLAHHLEDLLSKIKSHDVDVDSGMVDLLLEGVDLLEKGLSLIEDDKSEDLSAKNVLSKIKNLLDVEKKEEESFEVPSKIVLSDDEKKVVDEQKNNSLNVFRVVIAFNPENELKSARALLLIRDLSSKGVVIRNNPGDEVIKNKDFFNIDLLFSSSLEENAVKDIINKISGISGFVLLGLDDEFDPDSLVKEDDNKDDVKNDSDKLGVVDKHKVHIESVKVNMKSLDTLMNLVGELLISDIRLKNIYDTKSYEDLGPVLTSVERLITDLKDEVMEVRMLPIGHIFNRYPRMIRDLASKEDKKINFEMEGEDIKFDRTVLDEIGDPLIHLLRNSVDHGVEVPGERVKKGKPEEGLIKLTAKRDKNNAIIEIFDDGEGIDPEKIKGSCLKKGLFKKEELDKMSSEELQRLIFLPGMSTNNEITDVSGRGVGMDVVLSKISSLGGSVFINSELGKGTRIKLELPLTVAIITSFLVRIEEEIYAIPLANIDENVDVNVKNIKTIRGNKVFVLRGKEVPLFKLKDLTGLISDDSGKESFKVVVINRKNERVGLVVDEILSEQQILIKALQPCIKNTKGVSGVTILGTGGVALIIDVNSLFN